MRRFFLQGGLHKNNIITGDDAHHIRRVLRLQPGDEFIVVAADGQAGRVRITGVVPEGVVTELLEELRESKEPPVDVWLAQGLPKSDKMDYIVQKAVELGVSRIWPIATLRSVVQYDHSKQQARIARWQKIAAEASKQCGRTLIPAVMPVHKLQDLVTQLEDDVLPLLLYEAETVQGMKAALAACKARTVLLIIGPEGGFAPEEVALCQQYKIRSVSMGPRILRTETAALAALAVVMYQCGDLGGCTQ